MTGARPSIRPVGHIDAIGVGGLVLLSLVAYFAIVDPVLSARSESAAMRSQLIENQQRQKDLQQSQRDLGRRLEEARRALATGQLQLQPAELLNRRMARVIELASAHGIEIHAMRPGTTVNAEQYQMVPIELSGHGSYPDCVAFLHGLHETLPDMGVTNLKLSGNPASPATPTTFRFDVLWYTAPPLAGASP